MPKENLKKLFVAIIVIFTVMTVFARSEAKGETSLEEELVEYATSKEFLGLPYCWGGTSPETGFDCSGFVRYVYSYFGINIPRTTYDQRNEGSPVATIGELVKGDLVFFYAYDHVGIYIGENQMVHSGDSGLEIASMEEDSYYANNFCGGAHILSK